MVLRVFYEKGSFVKDRRGGPRSPNLTGRPVTVLLAELRLCLAQSAAEVRIRSRSGVSAGGTSPAARFANTSDEADLRHLARSPSMVNILANQNIDYAATSGGKALLIFNSASKKLDRRRFVWAICAAVSSGSPLFSSPPGVLHFSPGSRQVSE